MAGETTTSTLGAVTYSNMISEATLPELRPLMVYRDTFRLPDNTAVSASRVTFPTIDKVLPSRVQVIATGDALHSGADFTDLSGQLDPLSTSTGEGSAFTGPAISSPPANTITSTTSGVAQSQLTGIMTFLADAASLTSILNALPYTQQVLGRTMGEKIENDYAQQAATFNSVTGNSAQSMSWNLFLQGKGALTARDVHDASLCSILSTKQVNDLQIEVVNSGSAFYAGSAGQEAAGVIQQGMTGTVGTHFGVDVRQTTVVPKGDTGASVLGAMYVKGEALGLLDHWGGVRTELQRVAHKTGTNIVLTGHYGTARVSNARGQIIKSAA